MNKKQKEMSLKSDKTLRNMYSTRRANGMPIEPELHAELIARFSGYDPVAQEFIGNTSKQSASDPDTIKVEIKPLKSDRLSIYINGRVMTHVPSTCQIKTMGDGTLLGIQYMQTQIGEPLHWTVYDTSLTPNKWTTKYATMFTKPVIQNVFDTPACVKLILSNQCTVLLELDKLKRLSQNKIFKIVEKTK